MAINRKKIIEEISKIRVIGNEEGLIPIFGVYVQQLPSDFWNGFARRIVSAVSEDLVEAAEALLINAAQECAYHTGHGLMTSDEWNNLVTPMIEKDPDDTLHGAFALISALGWGQAEILDLVPNQKLIARAYNYYESDIMFYGTAKRPTGYAMRGICAAFMDLAYGGPYDVTSKTGIRTFKCEQTKGIEMGDEYGEFVTTRAN